MPSAETQRRASAQLVGAVARLCYAMRQAANDEGMDGNANIRAKDRGLIHLRADLTQSAPFQAACYTATQYTDASSEGDDH
jgi:hypothetical protein